MFQVSECNWPSRQAPSLHNLFAVCKNMHNWLKQNPKNVCVITCSVRNPPPLNVTFIQLFFIICIFSCHLLELEQRRCNKQKVRLVLLCHKNVDLLKMNLDQTEIKEINSSLCILSSSHKHRKLLCLVFAKLLRWGRDLASPSILHNFQQT